MEQWKVVEGTNRQISISNLGRVMGATKILKTQTDAKGYQRVTITVNGVKCTYKVHRLVAEAFIPNPENKPQVNHKDTNKSNNRSDNLEWATNKENAHHARANGLWVNFEIASEQRNQMLKKPIVATSKDGTSVIHFESVSAAENHFGTRHISAVLKGKRSHAKGYSFAYCEKGVV